MATLSLKTSKGRSLAHVPEFYVGSEPGVADRPGFRQRPEGSGGLSHGSMIPTDVRMTQDERSALLSNAAVAKPK